MFYGLHFLGLPGFKDTKGEAMVTGKQVQDAVYAANVTYIPYYTCGCCGEVVAYFVQGGNLYLDPSCGCATFTIQPKSWDDAAEWINMQSDDTAKAKIMQKFRLPHNTK